MTMDQTTLRITKSPDAFGDYALLEGSVVLNNPTVQLPPQPPARRGHLVLALDVSGSMAGAPYKVRSGVVFFLFFSFLFGMINDGA